MPRYWLFKTEPETFSVDDLASQPNSEEVWDGIRNYQARNLLRDDIRFGDRVFIYHSRTSEPAVVGVARVTSRQPFPDPLQFDADSAYYDPKSPKEDPRWVSVKVKLMKKLPNPVTLKTIKDDPELEGIVVGKRGMRLSIQPVDEAHFLHICRLGGLKKIP